MWPAMWFVHSADKKKKRCAKFALVRCYSFSKVWLIFRYFHIYIVKETSRALTFFQQLFKRLQVSLHFSCLRNLIIIANHYTSVPDLNELWSAGKRVKIRWVYFSYAWQERERESGFYSPRETFGYVHIFREPPRENEWKGNEVCGTRRHFSREREN